MIKWVGYSDSENTWEPMSLLDDWDIEREQIYKCFEDENIDILGVLNLILLTGSSRKKKKEMFLIRQAFLLMNNCVQRRYVVTKLT